VIPDNQLTREIESKSDTIFFNPGAKHFFALILLQLDQNKLQKILRKKFLKNVVHIFLILLESSEMYADKSLNKSGAKLLFFSRKISVPETQK